MEWRRVLLRSPSQSPEPLDLSDMWLDDPDAFISPLMPLPPRMGYAVPRERLMGPVFAGRGRPVLLETPLPAPGLQNGVQQQPRAWDIGPQCLGPVFAGRGRPVLLETPMAAPGLQPPRAWDTGLAWNGHSEELPEDGVELRVSDEEFGDARFVDCHCHLDWLMEMENHIGTLAAYRRLRGDSWSKCYESCITNFCRPDSYRDPNGRWSSILQEDGVYATFSCHPHFADCYSSDVEALIWERSLQQKVPALGEIGLDYSYKNQVDPNVQKETFRSQLILANKLDKPIVIHCREAEEDCFGIMKEVLPHDYLIHRHCFTEGMDWAQRWFDYFPNLFLGLTPLVAAPTRDRLKVLEVVKEAPLSRLLVETDAPFFVPKYLQNRLKRGHPGLGVAVAVKLAAERSQSPRFVLQQLRLNTSKLFRL